MINTLLKKALLDKTEESNALAAIPQLLDLPLLAFSAIPSLFGDEENDGNSSENTEKDEYTLKEASKKIGVSEQTLKRRMKDGKLHAEIKDGKYVISNAELVRFVNELPKYKKKLEERENKNESKSSKKVIDELHKTADRMIKRPETINLMAKRYEIDEKIIDLKIEQLKLDMEIYKDETPFLEDIKKRLYKLEARKVDVQNSLNSLNFFITHRNETSGELLQK